MSEFLISLNGFTICTLFTSFFPAFKKISIEEISPVELEIFFGSKNNNFEMNTINKRINKVKKL